MLTKLSRAGARPFARGSLPLVGQRGVQQPSRVGVARATPESAQPSRLVAVAEWDVIFYSLPQKVGDASLGVGVVAQVNGDSSVELQRLSEEATSSGSQWLVEDHSGTTELVPLSSVVQVVEADYGQRIDPDRVSNPHGEHAEEVWQLLIDVPPQVYRGSHANQAEPL